MSLAAATQGHSRSIDTPQDRIENSDLLGDWFSAQTAVRTSCALDSQSAQCWGDLRYLFDVQPWR
ncbi:hypothetical protein [Streptomyces sp. IMTB 2501]|uniref:hypothetical protein n=1 Tax=Streptomyces sp. IMTB 2501 TaxID=1776340 RepID=UPI00117CEC88|nr:hypothetical protein [Streptomyces sp. IMTB 2501]